MAKNKIENIDDNNPEKKAGFGSAIVTVIIVLVIFIIWLLILGILIKFDIGGIGNKTFRPLLQNVPVLNNVLPDLTPEEEAYLNNYKYKNMTEAMNRIKELEELTDKLYEENEDYATRQLEMQKEIENLEHYRKEFEDFMLLREAFDTEVVYNDKAPNTDEYIKWYESMYPETSKKIYEELAAQKQKEKIYEDMAAYVSKMKAKDAAAILEEMTSDIEFICSVLECLKTQQVSDILTAFEKNDPEFGARVMKYWTQRNLGLLED